MSDTLADVLRGVAAWCGLALISLIGFVAPIAAGYLAWDWLFGDDPAEKMIDTAGDVLSVCLADPERGGPHSLNNSAANLRCS